MFSSSRCLLQKTRYSCSVAAGVCSDAQERRGAAVQWLQVLAPTHRKDEVQLFSGCRCLLRRTGKMRYSCSVAAGVCSDAQERRGTAVQWLQVFAPKGEQKTRQEDVLGIRPSAERCDNPSVRQSFNISLSSASITHPFLFRLHREMAVEVSTRN